MFRSLCAIVLLTLLGIASADTNNESPTLDIQHWTTTNGTRVYFTHSPQIPIVDIVMAFDAGSNRDGELPGIALLTNSLLNQGSAEFDATTIAENFENVGALFSFGTARDMATLSLRSLSDPRYLEAAIANLALIISQPQFTANAIDRERNSQLGALQASAQQIQSVAADAFYQTLFTPSAYAHSTLGDATHLAQISREDIVNFYKNYYVARNAILVLVGAIDMTQAKEIAEQLSHGISQGKAAPSVELSRINAAPNVSQAISFPSTQTMIVLGQSSINHHSSDFYALQVANHILGGNPLLSRLAKEVRETRGLTYGISSYFNLMKDIGAFIVTFSTRSDQADAAIELVKNMLNDYINSGPNPIELAKAKQSLTGRFALKFENNSTLAGLLLTIGYYQLPLDYLETYVEKINALDEKSLQQALQRHLSVDDMVLIRVG